MRNEWQREDARLIDRFASLRAIRGSPPTHTPGSAVVYLQTVTALLDDILQTQLDVIDAAALVVANALAGGGRILVAETNHTLPWEATGRAGGFVAAEPLAVDGGGRPPTEADVALFGGNAGNDAAAVQLALMCRENDCPTIALLSLPYATARDILSEHPSGLRVDQVADIVVDIGGVVGDAVIRIPGQTDPIAPTSGAVSVAVMWAILAESASKLADMNLDPIVYPSIGLPGGRAAANARIAEYEQRGAGVRRPVA